MAENKQYYYVYKLFNPECSEFYIGSTKNMKHRMGCHKNNCNNENLKCYNYKVYRYIRSNGGFDSWQFEVLEHIRNSINIKELHGVERKYIEELQPTLNVQKPNRTRVQHYQDNKEALLLKQNQYYHNNREAILSRQNQKFECPCGGRYTSSHKAHHFKSKKHRAFEQS